jgi:hypothetical protein
VVTHAYNPSYLENRDEENYGSMPAWEKNMTCYLKNNQKGRNKIEGVN